MAQPLKVLFIEDSAADAELEQFDLEKAGIVVESMRVETPEDLQSALIRFKPDLVISDFTLPKLDGLGALRIVRQHDSNLPFIFVSGTIGEERAIESMKEGATDYVLKGGAGALIPRVRRALQEAEDRKRRKRLEKELHHAQKMDAIGRLSGAVAHDFNNILTVITGFSQFALDRLPPGDPSRHEIEEIIESAKEASSLTRQLLTFSRQQTGSPVDMDLNRSVSEMARMLERVLGIDIIVEVQLDEKVRPIKADPGQIEQIIMMLAIHARESMPSGGRLTLETRLGTDREHVSLRVTDNGAGISEETKAHLFEPFYESVHLVDGSRMGMAAVYGMVGAAGGTIDVESREGFGTTFWLRFPVSGAGESPGRNSKPESSVTPGPLTVLLVDSSESVRNLERIVLEKEGLTVLTAVNAEEALRVAREHTGAIHLIISDLLMEKRGDKSIVEHLRAARPGLEVLFTSGLQKNIHLNLQEDGTSSWFLAKPFTPAELAHLTREILKPARGT
jgi:two-component system cell cycle sensor histidine kinase/response regulator CckA